MMNTMLKRGVVKPKNDAEYTAEELKLIEEQDSGYMNLRLAQAESRLSKMEENMPLRAAQSATNNHIVFVDSDDESSVAHRVQKRKAMKTHDVAKDFDTHPLLMRHKENRLKMSQLENELLQSLDPEEEKKRQHTATQITHEQEKLKKIRSVLQQLQTQKDLRDPTGKQVNTGGKHDIYKWEKRRKR
eukprot:Platyproteum_vivax@DN1882_c0_g1_i2.p1